MDGVIHKAVHFLRQDFQAISHVLPAILSKLVITPWIGTLLQSAKRQRKVWGAGTGFTGRVTQPSMLLWTEFPLSAAAPRPHHLLSFRTQEFCLRALRLPGLVGRGKQGHLEDSLPKCTPGPSKRRMQKPFLTRQICPELSSHGSFLPRYLSGAQLHEHHARIITPLHNTTHWLRLTAQIEPWESQHPTHDTENGHDHIHLGFRWKSFGCVCHLGMKATVTPWSCTSLRKTKVRATPWPIQDSINSFTRERKGSFWLPEKTFEEVGFLKYLLRSCVGLC